MPKRRRWRGALFAVDGVTGVFFGADFITVTKAADQDWYALKPAVLGAIMEHYLSGDPVLERPDDLEDEARSATRTTRSSSRSAS